MTEARFTQGSMMQHVVVMTTTASVGLMALFVVDLMDMYFLSLLGEVALAAAIGYAGSILFFTTSICIGIAIAMGALVSRSLGSRQLDLARRYVCHVMVFGAGLSVLIAVLVWWGIPVFLDLLDAQDRARELATQYLRIIIPSMPVLALAMSASGVLRAKGDAKRAMYATLAGGLVNAVLDPVFIFGFDLGVQGAAMASVAARIAVLWVALRGVITMHRLLGRFQFLAFLKDLIEIGKIALPAILTNVATPLGNAYVMASIAQFGDSAVAGMSIIGRLIPVAFGLIFALSGAVGPILGQNYGARRFDRVLQGLSSALLFTVVTVTGISILLFLLQDQIIYWFGASGEGAELIAVFCTWVAITFIFNGGLFIANAAFNNLGRPHYSTLLNFGKVTLGTIPFVYLGALWFGAVGVIVGQSIGSVIFGVLATVLSYRRVQRCATGQVPGVAVGRCLEWRLALWPQTSTRG